MSTSLLRADSIGSIRARFSEKRLNWAFRAYDKFISSLSQEIQNRLTRKEAKAEAFVVVFGKTQVGKTSLLLDLMGVQDESMGRVSQVLRGGRPEGRSSTVTTTEYRHSHNNDWGLRTDDTNDRWFSNDDEMKEALGEIRKAMEREELCLHSPCVIFIPLDCLCNDADQPKVRMLDLPGDQADRDVERKYVEKMAKDYVPLADLILLVGRGEDLGFLKPGALTLPGIEYWQSVPRRFRIITTYSFTAQTVQELVEQNKNGTIKYYRERLIKQIESYAPLSDDARREDHFFPLEFGRSWHDAKTENRDLYEKITPLIEALKRQLREDITNSTTPTARLRAAVDVQVVIARVSEDHLQEMRTEICDLIGQRKKARNELQQVQKIVKSSAEEYQRISERLDTLSSGWGEDINRYINLCGNSATDEPDESVSGFKLIVRTAKSSLLQRTLECRPSLPENHPRRWFWLKVKAEIDKLTIEQELDKSFKPLICSLNGYWFDKYWLTGKDSDYFSDKQMFHNLANEAKRELENIARMAWLKAANLEKSKIYIESNSSKFKLREFEEMVPHWTNEVLAASKKLKSRLQDRRAFKQKMTDDLKESRRFVNLLESEYLAEIRYRRKIIREQASKTSGFLELLSACQLATVRKQLLLHLDSTVN